MASPIKTLALVGCSENEESVITSLLDLLSDEMDHHWQIHHRHDRSDCLLINTSTHKGISLWHTHASRGARRIALTDGAPPVDAQAVLKNPIRAYELISLLKQKACPEPVGATILLHPTARLACRYRLKRWPDTQVLRQRPEFTRLSATLLRHALTVDMLSDITQTPTAMAYEFVETCKRNGWLTEVREMEAHRVMADPPQANKGLFAKIRARLGLPG